MKKYRATLGEGPLSDRHYSFDMEAENEDQVFKRAREINKWHYPEVWVEELPDGVANWGVKFKYEDTCFKRTFTDHVIIRANSEREAKEFYNKFYKGKRFWFHAGKIEGNGKCVYGAVVETYLAACPGFDMDATACPC